MRGCNGKEKVIWKLNVQLLQEEEVCRAFMEAYE